MRRVALVAALLFAGSLAACEEEEKLEDRACPPGSTLTYETFGRAFFERWCVRCHGGPNGYSGRAFVTVELIRADRERIFVNAAGRNDTMPPGPDDPPREERERLAEWLACGAR